MYFEVSIGIVPASIRMYQECASVFGIRRLKWSIRTWVLRNSGRSIPGGLRRLSSMNAITWKELLYKEDAGNI